MKIHYGKVYLPHINYTVWFRPFKQPPRSIANARAWIQHEGPGLCSIYLLRNESPSSVAHEITHALAYICHDLHIQFEDEFEHMAYTMQYLLGFALGYEYVKSKPRR